MSRSFGESVVHDPVADRDRAVRDALEPGDHPERGRLAAPGRPDEHEELAVCDVEREVLDRVDVCPRRSCRRLSAAPQPLRPSFVVTRVSRHGTPARRSAEDGVDAIDLRVLAHERLELVRAESRRAGARTGSCPPRVARQSTVLAGRLAHVGDRVGGDVRVADARRGASARLPRRSATSSRYPSSSGRVPRVGASTRASSAARPRPTRPRDRSRRRRTPSARPASSSAGRRRRAAARASPRSTRKRAVSWLSRIAHEWSDGRPRDARAERAHRRRDGRLTGKPRDADRESDEAARGIRRKVRRRAATSRRGA